MIFPEHLRQFVVIPVLEHMASVSGVPQIGGDVPTDLLLSTIAAESDMGYYLSQYPTGPARGICQMETATFLWTVTSLEARYPSIWESILSFTPYWATKTVWDQLPGNLNLAVALCRGRYWLDPKPLPQPGDAEGLWQYYKRVWNTTEGKATRSRFLTLYNMYVKRI